MGITFVERLQCTEAIAGTLLYCTLRTTYTLIIHILKLQARPNKDHRKRKIRKYNHKGNLKRDHGKHRKGIIIAPQGCCVHQVKYSWGEHFANDRGLSKYERSSSHVQTLSQ